MSPDRFRRIEELYHEARECNAEERAAFFSQCDPDLRREVESLFADAPGCEFLDRPAIQNAPELLARPTAAVFADGVSVGPYRIESKLGEGGMGEVFRAVDTRLGRVVAIKTAHEQFSARFEREGRAIASLNHPHICTLHDVGPNYLVMELVEGETLAQCLKSGPLPLETVVAYGLQIAAALAQAHAKGIIHRDLKPGNIMIAKSGIKVLDFGLATSDQDETNNASQMVMGTPAYMSPEQRAGKTADSRSDIYSFGCVLYEMLTGASASGRTRRIRPRKLERIVARCLEEEPARRWQSVAELERALAGVTPTARGRRRVLVATTAVLGISAAAFLYDHRTPKLTDKDTIVLADFVNNTGDPIFDGTLRQGVAIQLEQSPFLKIMDDGQARRVLRRMSLPPGSRITNAAAREICVREGAAATIDGAIASLGDRYVVTLQATTCPAGATLAREQVEARDKEHVLKAVGTAASAMRAKLGESLSSIQKLNRPLEQATTQSIEALQIYTGALSEMGQGHYLATVPLFQRAIAIDPNFAIAYYHLAVLFEQAGDIATSAEYAKQALRLVDRVSEYERRLIIPYYYRTTGEWDREMDGWHSSARTYPRNWGIHNQLSVGYIDVGRYEDGLKEGLEATRLEPNVEPPYRRQLDAYICLDRLPEARQLEEKLRLQGLGGARIHQRYLEMAYVEGDQGAIAREIKWFAGTPDEYLSFGLQAADRNVHGRRRESHQLYQRATDAARKRGLGNAAAEFEEAAARADAFLDNCRTARRLGRPALALAECGDAAGAEKLAAETSKLFPNGTVWNAVELPEIRAAIALNRNQPAKSVELLASAAPYERAYLASIYLRGLAYLQLGRGAEAAAEFRKIAQHKGVNWGATWIHPYWGQFYSLSYLGMARGYALAGDTANARKAFEDFFELWKDADHDIPVLGRAKAEYARLRN